MKAGMAVDADFSFVRRDIAGMKEWSVDLAATWYSAPNKIDYALHFLIECKYRSPEKFLLLLPDPNDEFSPITLGGTVNILDQFSNFHLNSEPFEDLEKTYPFAYKGIEIHGGGANEEDLRHGIQQLRYATPAFLLRQLEFSMSSHPEDRAPLFFTKILLTNAPVRILNHATSIDDIRKASDVERISTQVPCAILFSDYGPDFEDHFRQTFMQNSDRLTALARDVADDLIEVGKQVTRHTDPIRLIENFATANRRECLRVGTQFFVTTLTALPDLLRAIKRACKASFRERTKVDRVAEWVRRASKKPKQKK